MAIGLDTIVMSMLRGYVDDSIRGITGALAGKNCTIESVTKADGLTTMVFKWTADDGTERRSTIQIEDGTPIYVWTAGDTYKYGDLVIYASAWYRCITENHDSTFDPAKWNEIGSADGNYDIVQSVGLLPARFTSADRKMYYVINERCFYLWNGYQWDEQAPKTITKAEIDALFDD